MQKQFNIIRQLNYLIVYCLLQSCLPKFDQPLFYLNEPQKATMSIRQLKDAHIPGNMEKMGDNQVITGIVIANDATDNFYKTIVIQDSTAGIAVRIDGIGLANDYPLGKRVFIKLNGLWLGEYGGMIQLGGAIDRTDPLYPELLPIPSPLFSTKISVGGMEKIPAPALVRFDQLTASLHNTLIELNQVELDASDTARPFADALNKLTVNHTLRICGGGSLYLRTSGFASFARCLTPSGNGRAAGIYTVYGSQKQLILRDTADLSLHGTRCAQLPAKKLFFENFESVADDIPIALGGWKNIPETGSLQFVSKTIGTDHFAAVSAFASGQPVLISWLILPAINLSNIVNGQLSFLTKDAFDNGATLQVYISTNYDGVGQPWKAKWTLLKSNISKGSVTGMAASWVSSGKISLSAYTGNIYIAFKYEGGDLPASPLQSKTTQYYLDDILVTGT